MTLNRTHDANARSWLDSANAKGTDFPIQNLPFAVFKRQGSNESFRGGIAIGDQIIDLAALSSMGAFNGNATAEAALAAASKTTLNEFMSMGQASWSALRGAVFDALVHSTTTSNTKNADAVRASLLPQSKATYAVPTTIGDYSDFYTSIHHASNIGKLFRGADNALTPNFKWVPIAYHGRASSIGVSGQQFHRPMGQYLPPPVAGAAASTPHPIYAPCNRLDYELELGIYIGPGNRLGDAIPIRDAGQQMFGICLLNDWSARDIQSWEYVPLGPFLGKNFATTISPWIITAEALLPFRQAWLRPADDPAPLPYLDDVNVRTSGSIDIQLSVSIGTEARRSKGIAPAKLTQTSFRHQYWTIEHMITQHAMGGCNLNPGDLLGSGTISGPDLSEAGAMIELTKAGREPVSLTAEVGLNETRSFLLDGDEVILKGWCEKPGFARIGFGECRGTVLPAKQPN